MRHKMTVDELINDLKKAPKDAKVILSADEEGNSFRFLTSIDVGLGTYDIYENEIDIGVIEVTDNMKNAGYTEEDVKSKKAIIIG